MTHDRFNNWLCTGMFVVGITAFTAIGTSAVVSASSMYALLEHERDGADNRRQVPVEDGELPPGAWVNPGPFPDEQRTWADLFAACRLSDAWLGSTIEGEPVCYPMGQESAP